MTQGSFEDVPRLRRAQAMADASYASRRAAWLQYHDEHPEIYDELRRRALLMRERGARFSIRTLWEAMRWDFWMNGPAPEPYKMNNDYTPFYARELMEREPALEGVFETRGQR